MARMLTGCRLVQRLSLLGCGLLAWLGVSAASAQPAAPGCSGEPLPPALTLDQAVSWALHHNPELAALRQQHGIAAAAVVIAQTYPFNPIWENKTWATNGPAEAGITNRVATEQKLLMDIEIRGQGKYRRAGAQAALSRTDWEIANQEVALALRVIRAYGAVLYRQEKVRLIQEMIQVNEEAVSQVNKLVEAGRLRAAELILIRTEVADARAQLASGNSTLVPAWHELRRALGLVEEPLCPQGALDVPSRAWDCGLVTRAALDRRPDLHARQAAVAEADARVQLEIANRYGNPNLGPAYEYNETRVNFIGAQINLPIPVFNTHRGEILQRQAERTRVGLELRQIETQVRQDVQAALARLQQARSWLASYQQTVIPGLKDSLRQINALFLAGEPGVDLPRVIDVSRKLLRARDAELDARWEVLQAQADLAAAVGEPGLAIDSAAAAEQLGLCPTPAPETEKGPSADTAAAHAEGQPAP